MTVPSVAEAPELAAADADHDRQAGLLSASTVVVSALNYALSLVAIRFLSPGNYGRYISAQGLLLILGTASMAAVPWAVARHVATDGSRRAAAEAMRFGLRASVVQGVVLAAVAGGVLAGVGGAPLAVAGAAATFALSLVSAPIGLLQGQERLVLIAVIRLIEAAVRVALTLVLLALFAGSPLSAVVPFPLGSFVVVALGLAALRGVWPLRSGDRAVMRDLLRHALLLGAVQLALAALSAVDTIAILVVGADARVVAAYDVASVLGRVPLFLSNALSTAYYQPLARATDDAACARALRPAAALFALTVVPASLLIFSLPRPLLAVVSPHETALAARLLHLTAISGLLIGVMNLISTAHQAQGRYLPAIGILTAAAVLQPVALIVTGRLSDAFGFAVALVAVSAVATAVLLFDARSWLSWRVLPRRQLVLLVVGVALAAAAARVPLLWPAAFVVLALPVADGLLRHQER